MLTAAGAAAARWRFNAAPKSRQHKIVARAKPTSVLRSRTPPAILVALQKAKQYILLTIDDTVTHTHTH